MLDNLKLMLGIPSDDTDRDNLLNLIISIATARLKGLLGGINPPAELDHIVLDVSIARYNRIGSEGLASHTVDGESLAFADNDFAPFMDEIEAFLAAQSESALGKVRFL